jgi:hypothetical protein
VAQLRPRVILAGSDSWTDAAAIEVALCEVIEAYGPRAILVHAGSPGAAAIARDLWRGWGLDDEPHPAPADLGALGGRWSAAAIVAAGAEVALVFAPADDRESAAALCDVLARLAGIPTIRPPSAG